MGSYRYSQKIGRGGMAQVYLAIQEGIGGFEKPVVVKRIFPHLCESEHFVKMFLDEARLAATVRHPNVVEIFDIGHDEEGYFIVMEYLSGETVAFAAQTLSRDKRTVPPAIACRIGASVAAGLHYAHTAVDATGEPQPLVHRDVTPSNLMVCYNGSVKILDFGIAKAIESADETSDASAVKGKLSYLSPEQVHNLPMDARTDLFQLGIVLHEMLCGRRLFNARTNHEKITAVLERDIPRPSSINPEVPGFVDDIVLSALARDREQRVQSADELRRALEGALREMGVSISEHDLGTWISESFPKAREERLDIERFAIMAARNSSKVIDTPQSISPLARSGSPPARSGSPPARSGSPPARSGSPPARSGSRDNDPRFVVESPTPSASGQRISGAPSDVEQTSSSDAESSDAESSIAAILAAHAAASADLDDPDVDQPTVAIPQRVVRAVLDHPNRDEPSPAAAASRTSKPYWLGAVLLLLTVVGVIVVLARPASERADDDQAVNARASINTLADTPADTPADAPTQALREPATYDVSVIVVPENATLELDGDDPRVGALTTALPRDRATHTLVISAPGHERLELWFSESMPPPSVVRLHPHPGPAQVPRRQPNDRIDRPSSTSPGLSGEHDSRSLKPKTDNIDPWSR